MKKLLALGGGAVALVIAGVVAIVIVGGVVLVGAISGAAGGVVMAMGGEAGGGGGDTCTVSPPSSLVPGDDGDTGTAWTPEQIEHARIIIGVGKGVDAPERGWLVALMTAMQESTLNNLKGGDRDSQGLFQQRPSMGWGTVEQITTPSYSAEAFYLGAGGNPGLLSIVGWETMELTKAAQAVQRSAFPDHYAKWETDARTLLAANKDAPEIEPGRAGGGITPPSDSGCGGGLTPGIVTAAGDDYPGRNWIPDYGSVAGGLARECVDFTAWRMRQLTPGWDSGNPEYGSWYVLGNGAQWGDSARALGYTVDKNAKAGSIAYWGGGFGHVAFVAEVKESGTVVIEEYNMIIPGGGGASDYSYHTREINAAEPAGYIHFNDHPDHPLVPMQHSDRRNQTWEK